jgi:diguanylate cyclase (GGDEF)-like protein
LEPAEAVGPPPGEGRGPVFDIRVRWRAGQVALALAGLLTVAALARPLAGAGPAWLKLAVSLGLGLGVSGSALLASLKGRGQAEVLALYAFLTLALDGLGQVIRADGWPVWPLMAVMVAAVAVAETLPVALGVAGLASLLVVAEVAAGGFFAWRAALAASAGYAALTLAINRALLGEKTRLSTTLAELARLRYGIDQLEDEKPGAEPLRPNTAAYALKQVTEEGRRARQLDRAAELDGALIRLVRVARVALGANAVLYFDVDRARDMAYLRAADGPSSLIKDVHLPLHGDPFAFVIERNQSFYATDFKRLLFALPYYKGEMKVGSLLAVPVRTAQVIAGVLVADRLEIQSFTGAEPELLASFADLAADAILKARAALSREEADLEFRAVYPLSQKLATLSREPEVRDLLLRSARNLIALEGAAVVITDELMTHYTVKECHGWTMEFARRDVALSERTWSAWVLRSAEDPYLLDNLAGHENRMPILTLDEGASRGESLLAVPLRARNRTLGALILTGRRGAFDSAAHRVLAILANQAAATLSLLRDKDKQAELAVRDGLTGLYNRRAFNDLLAQAVAREDRQGGRFALLVLDLDHFKKLNDTYGHPAGDAALRDVAEVLRRHLRKGDQAARYGGEEFVAILPGSDAEGALHLAERIRAALQKHRLIFEGAKIMVTASFGLAVWPADGREPDALVAAGDRALYAAKEAGRNRVVAASSVAPVPPLT